MVKKYTPQKGDIVYINFNPQKGREQAGRRPAIILSPGIYNQSTRLALLCPITSNAKGYPFEVKLTQHSKTKGVVLSDHIKCLDWHDRKIKFLEKASNTVLVEVIAKLQTLLQ